MNDWKKKQQDDIRETEERYRDSIDDIDMFNVSFEETAVSVSEDTRDYVDRCFYDWSPERGITKKEIKKWECIDNATPEIPKDVLCVVLNYKMKRTQGKRDPLAGNHLLVIPADKEPIKIPLHRARDLFLEGLRALDSIEDALAEADIPLQPEEED